MRVPRHVLSTLAPVIFATVVFVALVGWATAQFGSLAAARAFLRGESLVVEPMIISLGTVKAGKPAIATFHVRNLTARDVRIVGSRGTCECVALTKMPVVVPARGTLDLEVRATPDETAAVKGFRERIELFVDAPCDPVILTINAAVE